MGLPPISGVIQVLQSCSDPLVNARDFAWNVLKGGLSFYNAEPQPGQDVNHIGIHVTDQWQHSGRAAKI